MQSPMLKFSIDGWVISALHFQLGYGDLIRSFTPVTIGLQVSQQGNRRVHQVDRHLLLDQQKESNSLVPSTICSTVIPFGGRIVCWRAEKGGEYIGRKFRQYCVETCIIQEFAATNTPKQKGVSERMGRTLCTMARCMLADSGFPSSMLGGLFIAAAYLKNRTPHNSRWRHHSKCFTAGNPISRTFASLDPEPLCTSRTPESSTLRPGIGRCAVIARRANLTESGAQRLTASWRGGTPSSSRHCHTCFPSL